MSIRRIVIFGILALLAVSGGATAQETQPFPDTTEGVHVFNDQIDVHNLSDAQAAFAATHYDGAQKLTRSGAERLRAYDPEFVVLHYRLGLGLGYRVADDNCQPTGEYLAYIDGDDWVQEWPGDQSVQEDWFYHVNGQREYWCAWGWYLADTDQPGWRDWWIGEIRPQIAASESDGLFADSVTVPNYLGAYDWSPALPEVDGAFEADWTRRIEDWMQWANQALEPSALVVNAGMLVTGRETTDYSLADGVMVEGFAGWGEGDRFELGDWLLQMNRILALVNRNRVVILQSYVVDAPERLWVLANYLLVKGSHTYVNIETSQDAEWFPEYDLPIGHPLDEPIGTIQGRETDSGLYWRAYSGGLVLVNPDPYGAPFTIALNQPYFQVTDVSGGGDIPEDADLSGWGVTTTPVSEVTVGQGQAAILLDTPLNATAAELDESAGVSQPKGSAVTAISAFHRSGQTFLTWPEIPHRLTMMYQVYRSTAPIDAGNFTAAQRIASVPQGSGIFWTERERALEPPYEDAGYRSLRNYVVTNLGEQLPDGAGLFVWTTHENGDFYYAVAADDGTFLGSTGPITEQASDPEPVLVWQSADGLSRVYTQFMDYAAYNPTFDAPRESNSWMSLPNWEELSQMAPQQQYAYNYWVGLPTPELCGGPVPDPLPLVLHIEGWGSRYAVPADALYWCNVHLWADDPNQSWYFGFSAAHDYRTGAAVTSGPIVNYTEERLLRALHEVLNDPDLPAIDENRIYVYGHSMGGTGALMLAERYPQIFAAAAASQPMMDFSTADMWIGELESKWGARSLNLPVEIRGPDAAPLTPYQGTGVWDWQNLGQQLSARRADDMAFIAIGHGTADTVIDWASVVRPSYTHFYTGSHAFIGEITDDDHTWMGFRDHPNWRFDLMNFRRDESLPALSYASGSLPVPPDGVGGYNMTLEWSSSVNDFAGPPVDSAEGWAVVLRSLSGDQTVDVTPRRLQQFIVEPGRLYTWQNVRLGDNAVIQEGTVSADQDHLITVPDFAVSESGNRLIIRP
jgi:pimeloyl-ACP methyl ester carboxylesterase